MPTTHTKKPPVPARDAHAPAQTPAQTVAHEPTAAEMEDLLGKAQRGDANAWRTLEPMLAKIPNWERHYDAPPVAARRMVLEAATGGNLFLREAWDRRTRALTTELAGKECSPLERILCERVATCWLDMSLAELSYATRLKEGMTFAAGEYYQKIQDRAHKRHLSACLTLAKVRRLLAPVAQQVNIAQPGAAQMNIAAPAAPASLPATVDAAP